MFGPIGDVIPRLIPENGLTYCSSCLQDIISKNAGKDTFFCPEDNETPIGRKERAEEYPKNFALLKMSEKYRKKIEE